MKKYKIEGNLNFYDELYKSLDENNALDEKDLCLITNTPLTENYVTLECNHKFNYVAIYNDILNHKKKFNSLEAKHLKTGQIRCPYCRNIQNNLLPYYNISGIKKCSGVNWVDENNTMSHYDFIGNCCFLKTSTDSNGNIININCSYNFCKIIGDKMYCPQHYRVALKEYNHMIKLKEKEEQKKAKKEEKQKTKDELKKAKEEAKQLMKTQLSINSGENVVISTLSSLNSQGCCTQILKTGKNKGTPCNCKVFKDTFCKRHYKEI